MIGRGSYGKVYMVVHVKTQKVYAMKSIKKDLVMKTDQVQGIIGKSHLHNLTICVTVAEREIL